MGTPDFSIPSLDILRRAGYPIVGVITAPDRPAGRGRKLVASPVKKYADQHELPVFQPEKLRNPEFLDSIKALQPDIAVVVAFRMLPELLWSIPSVGTFNLHASLLPDYRGAAPINWVIMNGEEKTGATTFFIDHKIDTGNLLLQSETDLPHEWTAGDLHNHLMQQGAELVLETVWGLAAGTLTPKPQENALFRNKAPKIFKEDCQINWDQPVEQVYNHIRGLSPYPTAWTLLEGVSCKVFGAKKLENAPSESSPPGTIQVVDESLLVACQDGWLELTEVQLSGKKRMPAAAFLHGYKDLLTAFTINP